ncbi:MAG: hypothetical protein ACK5PQ_02375 [Alphaproteobacteria bacterium]
MQDAIDALRDRQYLLVCLDRAIEYAYDPAIPELCTVLNNLGTILNAYDNSEVTAILDRCSRVLSVERKRKNRIKS